MNKKHIIKGKRTNIKNDKFVSQKTREYEQYTFLDKCDSFLKMNPNKNDRRRLNRKIKDIEKRGSTSNIRMRAKDIRYKNEKSLNS